jgi:hypothetical protein
MTPAGRYQVGLAVVGSLSMVPVAAHAQDDVRLSADAGATVGYSNNPFSVAGDDTGSAFVEVNIDPRATMVNERSVIILSGSLDYQRYLERYNDSTNYGADLSYSGTPSEHVRTGLSVGYDSSILGGDNRNYDVFDPAIPVTLPTTGTDLTLFGTRDRRNTLRTNGNISYTMSPRDTLTGSAYFIRARYDGFSEVGNYDGYGGTGGYSRQISNHLQLGVQGSVSKYNYSGALSDTSVYSVRGSFSTAFGPRWTANGALGVSFVDSSRGSGTSASLSGNLNLCRNSERSNLCATVSRAVVPSGVAGTRTETAVGGNYTYRLSERETLFANANYVKNGSNQLFIGGQNEYLRASGGYRRTLTERVRLVVSARYREYFGGTVDRASDYAGQAGVSIALGDQR